LRIPIILEFDVGPARACFADDVDEPKTLTGRKLGQACLERTLRSSSPRPIDRLTGVGGELGGVFVVVLLLRLLHAFERRRRVVDIPG
jgi:hypothetical protein